MEPGPRCGGNRPTATLHPRRGGNRLPSEPCSFEPRSCPGSGDSSSTAPRSSPGGGEGLLAAPCSGPGGEGLSSGPHSCLGSGEGSATRHSCQGGGSSAAPRSCPGGCDGSLAAPRSCPGGGDITVLFVSGPAATGIWQVLHSCFDGEVSSAARHSCLDSDLSLAVPRSCLDRDQHAAASLSCLDSNSDRYTAASRPCLDGGHLPLLLQWYPAASRLELGSDESPATSRPRPGRSSSGTVACSCLASASPLGSSSWTSYQLTT
ncbi:uncharacterized protein LOC133504823 isoform X1 [Syngnathoides biaculeatus]|uniref:uncharacterized protein LOC133504823 isoform X1 n=1 Tax=Syngnathoides biaculeatus TaxID=300417 RepID=UPI002ADD8415|nr:uncharacterized protein LOC133504823 isoform X1 [Syngnathoides biaculeatus]XP_061683443.1 uncharacterized protein LOC133504823 isoform X1 [Syngnathoides biaculeatus]